MADTAHRVTELVEKAKAGNRASLEQLDEAFLDFVVPLEEGLNSV